MGFTTSSDSWLPVLAVVRGCRSSWSRAGDGETGTPGEYVINFSYQVHEKSFQGWYFAGTLHEPERRSRSFTTRFALAGIRDRSIEVPPGQESQLA